MKSSMKSTLKISKQPRPTLTQLGKPLVDSGLHDHELQSYEKTEKS